MHDATGPEPDYRPSVGPTMVSITLEEYKSLLADREHLATARELLQIYREKAVGWREKAEGWIPR